MMRLTAKLAVLQLKGNRRRTIWTFIGIVLSTALLYVIYGLGFGAGLDWIDRITANSPFRNNYSAFISVLVLVMSIFVIIIFVIVISNAFRVSAYDRSVQFAYLKSVGATQKQIMETVIYEGIYLTLIAIPVGIIIGLILQIVGESVLSN